MFKPTTISSVILKEIQIYCAKIESNALKLNKSARDSNLTHSIQINCLKFKYNVSDSNKTLVILIKRSRFENKPIMIRIKTLVIQINTQHSNEIAQALEYND